MYHKLVGRYVHRSNVMILRSKTSKWFFVGFGWEMERKLHSFGHEARAKDIFLYEISVD